MDVGRTILGAGCAFIAVETALTPTGDADVIALTEAVKQIGSSAQDDLHVMIQATVPVGASRRVHELLRPIRESSASVVVNG